MPNSAPTTGSPWLALIDLGSNSVRLVLYDGTDSAARIVYNEKAVCRLADVDGQGNLRPESMTHTLAILRRFGQIVTESAILPDNVHLFATSALRDASNQKAFLNDIARVLPWPVEILSGAQEAELATLGVLHGHPCGHGMVGDLGGGSLELCALDLQGDSITPGNRVSLPLGTIRLEALPSAHLRQHIRTRLGQADWTENHGGTLYAVGGSWRRLGMLHRQTTGYPLQIIDGYRIARRPCLQFLSRVIHAELRYSLNQNRARLMPYAALLLEELLDYGRFATVEFSAAGVRDGVFYRQLRPEDKQQDVLLTAFTRFQNPRYPARYTDLLYDCLAPLLDIFPETEPRLVKALCILANFANDDHPEYRAEHAVNRVLHLPTARISHRDRVWLATAIAARYNSSSEIIDQHNLSSLIDERGYRTALALGSITRFCRRLCGGAFEILQPLRLRWNHNTLQIRHLPACNDLLTEEAASSLRRCTTLITEALRMPPPENVP